jgi:uncharacterized Fe-S cluster protein YjdI
MNKFFNNYAYFFEKNILKHIMSKILYFSINLIIFVKKQKMDKNDREYSNGEIKVFWKPKECIHAGICLSDLPKVFSLNQTPWINIFAAKTDKIIEVVDACPTDALTYEWIKKGEVKNSTEEQDVKVTIMKNGPIIINSSCIVTDFDGKKHLRKGVTALCTCSKTKKAPFCDGSHV